LLIESRNRSINEISGAIDNNRFEILVLLSTCVGIATPFSTEKLAFWDVIYVGLYKMVEIASICIDNCGVSVSAPGKGLILKTVEFVPNAGICNSFLSNVTFMSEGFFVERWTNGSEAVVELTCTNTVPPSFTRRVSEFGIVDTITSAGGIEIQLLN
jgi:hypothetical protein